MDSSRYRCNVISPDGVSRRVSGQGLLIGRAFYRRLGGFRPLPLMEDVDLVRRIGRSRLVPLSSSAETSAVRYERDGWLVRPLKNLACLSLYCAGVPTRAIARLYGR